MPKITQEQAKEFLNNIKENERIAIITHEDLDGFASGILLYDFCKQKKADVGVFILRIGKNSLKNFELKNKDKIIITDLAQNIIAEGIEILKNKKVLYTDHHKEDKGVKIPESILELRTLNKGYIPSSHTIFELTKQENKEKQWLAVAGVLGDEGDAYKENHKFINDFLNKESLKLKDYKENVTLKISNLIVYFKSKQIIKKAFNILRKINSWKDLKQIEKYSKEIELEIKKVLKDFKSNNEKIGEIIYFQMPKTKFSVKEIIINKLRRENPHELFVFLKKDEEKTIISTRHQSKKTSMYALLDKITGKFRWRSFGGYEAAAGATILTKDLEKFKQNLKKYSKTI